MVLRIFESGDRDWRPVGGVVESYHIGNGEGYVNTKNGYKVKVTGSVVKAANIEGLAAGNGVNIEAARWSEKEGLFVATKIAAHRETR